MLQKKETMGPQPGVNTDQNQLDGMHHEAQKIEQLKKMQTFGPVGEPEDGTAQQQSATSTSTNASG